MGPPAKPSDEIGDEGARRVLALIARSRPAAVAGHAEFWARLAELSAEEAAAALEGLAARGVVRRQALGGRDFYVADPPHAPVTPR